MENINDKRDLITPAKSLRKERAGRKRSRQNLTIIFHFAQFNLAAGIKWNFLILLLDTATINFMLW